jgi:hypothetical protein
MEVEVAASMSDRASASGNSSTVNPKRVAIRWFA